MMKFTIALCALSATALASYTAPPAPVEYKPAPAPYMAAPAPYTGGETPTSDPKSPHYTAPPTHHVSPPEPQCWTETRKCCYKEKADGYVCQDDYGMKQARCHAKIKYEMKCEKTEGRPEKPESYTKKDKCMKVNYDVNYGPHVQGYPNGGMSKEYDTKELPTKPHGVEAEPYPMTTGYAPAPAPVAAYEAPKYVAPAGQAY